MSVAEDSAMTEEEDDRVELLPHEESVMLDSMNDDVLFIAARGLGLERLVLHHLHMYNDKKLLVLVINTTSADEHYFLTQLKQMNPKCPPKLLNGSVLTKQRDAVYLEGGVQFITSRVLMMDLLSNRLPVQKVTGIIVYRAHEVLRSFQESFILRLYREKKSDGFVKAFTDNSTYISNGGIGQLQRLFDKLYIKKIRLLPRFDVVVKETYDAQPPMLCELDVELPVAVRKVRMALMDIIRTCVRELKQTVHSLEIEVEDDAMSPSAALYPSKLELDLKTKTLLLTDRQERLLRDLGFLRTLLRKVEDLDPYSSLRFLQKLRTDKEYIDHNSGWLFTPTAGRVLSGLESLCASKTEVDAIPKVAIPPKWDGLHTALSEICLQLTGEDEKVLVICPSDECCRQLVDVVKFGSAKFSWMLTKALLTEKNSTSTPGREPPKQSWWNSDCIILYDSQVDLKTDRQNLVTELQNQQKKAAKESKKRKGDNGTPTSTKKMKQGSLVNFGIVQYQKKLDDQNAASKAQSSASTGEDNVVIIDEERGDADTNMNALPSERGLGMLVLLSHGDRYNLINALENLKPSYIVLYHLDIASMRLIETYNAKYPEKRLRIYSILYKESAEEERYLLSIKKEQTAFEMLIREQGVLMVPSEYDVSRESATKLRQLTLAKDSRMPLTTAREEANKIIVDMREFNAELPTVLYRRGIDLITVTLEVGDYVLAPTVCVERKSLDDLASSLNNGRVFNQMEQMMRHYSRCVLLIESDEKFKHRKVNGGPFQGELSRRSRETRSLLTMLVRSHPKMAIIWASNPRVSAELFEEMKLDQPNPDLDTAVGIRSNDVADEGAMESAARSTVGVKLNAVVKRQLGSLPKLAPGDVDKLMSSPYFKTPKDIFTAGVDELSEALGNETMANGLADFFSMDFRFGN